MIRRLVLAAAAALFASQASAQAPPPPKLIVVISVDRLSSDLFDAYRPQFSQGLARIASGALFSNGSEVRGPSLGQLLKANSPGSRNVVVSGLRTGPGHADQHWFWSGSRFDTDVAGTQVPGVVSKANAALAAALAQARPALQPTPFCQQKPAKTRLARPAGDAAGLAASPELDGGTLALAAGLVDELQLGRRASPDVVSIDLAATGNISGAFGDNSQEMCLQLTELDREIGDFLALLDNRGVDYAVGLNGDAEARVPILFWRPNFRGAATATPITTADMNATLAALAGVPVAVSNGRCLEGTPAFCQQR